MPLNGRQLPDHEYRITERQVLFRTPGIYDCTRILLIDSEGMQEELELCWGFRSIRRAP